VRGIFGCSEILKKSRSFILLLSVAYITYRVFQIPDIKTGAASSMANEQQTKATHSLLKNKGIMSFIHCLMSSSLSLCTKTASRVSRSWTAKPTAGILQLQHRNDINNHCNSYHQPLLSVLQVCTTFLRGKHTLKTNKSVSKRFRVRGGSGHKKSVLTHMRSGARHNTGYRPRAAINKLGQSKPVSNKKVERKMKLCMGVL
jgi:ribosomal protein L35